MVLTEVKVQCKVDYNNDPQLKCDRSQMALDKELVIMLIEYCNNYTLFLTGTAFHWDYYAVVDLEP